MSLGASSSDSKSTSESGNKAFDFLQSTYGGQAQSGVGASNALSAMLGIGGTPGAQQAQQGAFQNYLNSSGYKFNLAQGQNAITSSNAASGLLNSGSALKGLAKYGQGLASNYLQQYMAQLQAQSQQGLGAGSLIGNAGQYSLGNSKSSSNSFNIGL